MLLSPRIEGKVKTIDELVIGNHYLFKYHKQVVIGKLEEITDDGKVLYHGYSIKDGGGDSSGIYFDDCRLTIYKYKGW